ncbi:MAG: hypothetical protein AAF889_15050 [Cyanobacteria bacterium P01_D01_bin.73]
MAVKRSAAQLRADLKYNQTDARKDSRARYIQTQEGLERKRAYDREWRRKQRAAKEGGLSGPGFQELRSHLKVFRALGWIAPNVSLQQKKPELLKVWEGAIARIARIEFHF